MAVSEEGILKNQIDFYSVFQSRYSLLTDLASKAGRDSIKKYLIDYKINKIVLYGAGVVGRYFMDLLNTLDCQVVAVVDQNQSTEYDFHDFLPIEQLSCLDYDLIVITPLNAYQAIRRDLDTMQIQKYCFISELIDYKGRLELYENGVSSTSQSDRDGAYRNS